MTASNEDKAGQMQQAEAKRIMNEIMQHARRLHELIGAGATISVSIPQRTDILVPNQPVSTGTIIITKPALHIVAQLKP